MAYLELTGLEKSFGAKRALDGVTFSVDRSEIACVVGPSGSGKSTLLKLLSGMLRPDAGSILIEGQELTAIKPHKRGIGLVPQDFLLFPHLSVYENVAFGLRIRKDSQSEVDAQVIALLEQMGIAQLAARRPPEISGGEAQRVALARALAIRPRAVLLDEPLAHVEPSLRRRLERQLVTTQRAWGVPFIIVTHSREEALAISDRLILLKDGQIVQSGKTRDVFHQPASIFAASFLGYETILPVRSVESEGALTRIDTELGKLEIPSQSLGPAPPAAVTFLPDGISLLPDAATGENVFTGTVSSSLFRGLDVDIQIAVVGAATLIAARVPEKEAPLVGDLVTFRLKPESLITVAA